MVYANPDFIELNDGRILLAYQWRYKKGYNDLAHTNENCGVGIMTSSDGGRSWSEGPVGLPGPLLGAGDASTSER